MFARIFGIDYRTLALFRVAIGLTVLANIVNLFPHITELFSDRGVMTRAAAADWMATEYFSLLMVSGLPEVQMLIFALAGVAALLFIAGWRTRTMTVLLWLFAVSVSNRNLIIQQGGDQLMPLLLFWAMFLPLGVRFSIDAALGRDAPRQDAALFTERRLLSPATFAILAQASYVYWVGALLKTGPEWIPDGTAVYYAMHLDSFAMPVTHWARQFAPLLTGLSYYVWGLEMAMPLLVFSPVIHLPIRLAAQAALITMHLGFVFFLGIGLFAAASISSLLLFTPSEVWDWLARKTAKRREGFTIFYDGDCRFCFKTALILREFCLPADTPIRVAQEDERARPLFEEHFSWVLIDGAGEAFTGWRAVNRVLRASPLWAPLGRLMDWAPLLALGERLYLWIGRNRGLLGRLSEALLPARAIGFRPAQATQALVLALAGLVFYLNMLTLENVTYRAPRPLAAFARALKLDQKWDMFAPGPAKVDGWIVIPGELEDGSPIELFTRTPGEADFTKPANGYFHFGDYRWRKYFNRLPDEAYLEPRKDYGRYLCRSWNIYEEHEQRLKRFEVIYMQERTLPPDGGPEGPTYGRNELTRVPILTWQCF